MLQAGAGPQTRMNKRKNATRAYRCCRRWLLWHRGGRGFESHRLHLFFRYFSCLGNILHYSNALLGVSALALGAVGPETRYINRTLRVRVGLDRSNRKIRVGGNSVFSQKGAWIAWQLGCRLDDLAERHQQEGQDGFADTY